MKNAILDKIACFLAELFGTGLLVFIGCMGCGSVSGTSDGAPSHFQAAFGFGLVVMIIIQCFGCVSGAHLNPAVTAAALVYKLVSPLMALVYFIAQMLGGFMGYGLLKLVTPSSFPNNSPNFCVTTVHKDISVIQAFTVEFVITSVLILVCCAVWDPRNAKHHDSVAIRFGLTVSALAMAAGPYTGGSMNPARSFGPALWNNHFPNHWIYWVAPLSSGFLVSLIFKLVFWREAPTEKPPVVEEFPLSRDKNYS